VFFSSWSSSPLAPPVVDPAPPMVMTVEIGTGFEILGLTLVSPEYNATKEKVPAGKEDAVNVAIPDDIATGEPKLVPLSNSCTIPVAVLGDMVAVNVTE